MSQSEFDPSQVDAIRNQLEQSRQALQDQLKLGNEATQPVALDQQSVGRVSRIDAIQQQQMALASRDQAEQQLRQVELALKRIESGEYGYCQSCEEPIKLARLQAQPFARLCIACQSASESG